LFRPLYFATTQAKAAMKRPVDETNLLRGVQFALLKSIGRESER
jgi:hypothetical protein